MAQPCHRDVQEYTTCACGIDTVIEDPVQALELANVAKLTSRVSYGASLQAEYRNGSNCRVEHIHPLLACYKLHCA